MKTLLPAALGVAILAAAPTLRAETLKVDQQRSRIQVDAQATGHKFTGTLADYDLSVQGDALKLQPMAVKLTWKFADLKTGEEKRDAEMIKWLGGGGPVGSFEFIKTWKDGSKDMAQGKIIIHGMSKTIAFPYSATKDGNWVTIDGTAALNYQDFGLPLIRNMAVMKVEPALAVRFHLVGKTE
ncbi:YceI family protein [Haloferula sp. BvORR071]|uniref:YceI family protein n=1 Tax=Haloferula sp. BvORR071 TaxID=1396141 RepID=UPI00054EB4B3|nr:YceI family protein [Haloferula sp. BvORR071]